MREIVLDTETTGLDHRKGDRLIELGCIELFNRIPTGRELHHFLDPEGREVHPDAEAIHGISTASLQGKPKFRDVVDEFLTFIADDTLVIHNASFDIGFLNAELERLKRPAILMDRVVDTLAIARRKHPAGPNSLDALCKRYGVDNSRRDKHGAIIDSLLLAGVYVELLGERQANLGLLKNGADASSSSASGGRQRRGVKAAQRPSPLPSRVTADDIARHRAFVDTLGPTAAWKKFLEPPAEPIAEAKPA